MIGTVRPDHLRDLGELVVASHNVTVSKSLVVLSGLPATGKSTVARAIASATGLPIIGSDDVRTRLLAARTYSAAESELVYDHCRRLATLALSRGQGAIIDATNLYEATRRLWSDLASDHGAAFLLVIVKAPREVVVARMARRATVPDPAYSEATQEVYERLRRVNEPTMLPHLVFRTVDDNSPRQVRVDDHGWLVTDHADRLSRRTPRGAEDGVETIEPCTKRVAAGDADRRLPRGVGSSANISSDVAIDDHGRPIDAQDGVETLETLTEGMVATLRNGRRDG